MHLLAAVAAQFVEFTTFFFGGASGAALAPGHSHEVARDRLGRVVSVVLDGHWVADALVEESGHFDDAFPARLAKRDGLTNPELMRGLDWLAIDLNLPAFDCGVCC